ncbi:MAG: potassium transporter TrkG, partial [Bacillota bacterium]|nr:potassium transporter TrkG [Bacillota bacterium]
DGYDMSKSTLIDALFQVTSFITTTGYTTSNYENWPSTCIMLLVFLMFVGGCSSSTSGGLKVIRTTIVLRLIKRGISTRLHPHIYKTLRISGRSIPRDTTSGVVSHVFLYILLLFIGTFLISFENLDLSSCFTSIIACLSNIGIGFSDVGIDKNFGFMSNFSKLVLTLFMIGGRLEGYTLFVLFTPYTWIRRG